MTTSLEKSQRTVMVPEVTVVVVCLAVTGRHIQPDRGQEEPWPAPT
jgi:hypothetical protein